VSRARRERLERTLTLRVEIPLREADHARLYEAGLRERCSHEAIVRAAVLAWLERYDAAHAEQSVDSSAV
jgi:hypothetical protein